MWRSKRFWENPPKKHLPIKIDKGAKNDVGQKKAFFFVPGKKQLKKCRGKYETTVV